MGRQDNFFELGGHSLLALRAANLLYQRKFNIFVADLFAHPTIESLAANIGLSGQPDSLEKATCIRDGGSELPLFLTHCGGGQLYYLRYLAPHIDSQIPVYGLPAKPIHETPLRTVEGMAARMVRMIRAVQPVGPYRIAGWSFGGTLAYEIATQLIAADQRVDFIGLFDTWYPAAGNHLLETSSNSDEKTRVLDAIQQILDDNPTHFTDINRQLVADKC